VVVSPEPAGQDPGRPLGAACRAVTRPEGPDFHEFATSWLTRRKPSFKERTYEHYRYLLTNHLLPRLARLRLSQIDYSAIDRYVEAKQLESEEVREAARREVALREASGARKRPLANSTINATLELLSSMLEEAVRRKLIPANPARERGLRLKEQRTRGNVLEIDELEDLLAAAEELDQKVTPRVLERSARARATRAGSGVEGDRPASRRGANHGDLLRTAGGPALHQPAADDHLLPRRVGSTEHRAVPDQPPRCRLRAPAHQRRGREDGGRRAKGRSQSDASRRPPCVARVTGRSRPR
jgi:hypothetical protein